MLLTTILQDDAANDDAENSEDDAVNYFIDDSLSDTEDKEKKADLTETEEVKPDGAQKLHMIKRYKKMN